MIQTLAPDRTDEALGARILPGAVRRREDFGDPHALHSVPKLLAVDLVTVAQEIGRRGESVHDLLGGPVGGGVLGHVEVDDAPAMVGEHDEDEEDAEPRGGHGEEIDRDQVPDVIGQKRPPGLRGRGAPLREQPRDGALGHIDAELQKLTMDSRGAPERVRGGEACNEGVPSKNSSVVILLRFSKGSGYVPRHGQMAWDPHWDPAIHGSHAPGVGAGEPRASAATRGVEGAPAAATTHGYGPELLGCVGKALERLEVFVSLVWYATRGQ